MPENVGTAGKHLFDRYLRAWPAPLGWPLPTSATRRVVDDARLR